MEIGAIGAGDFAQAFAKRVLKAGHKVLIQQAGGPLAGRDFLERAEYHK
jgi:3-hydroxyisobutyrate dehydrogenase-like beta-hydroxyacid dehydrogenase